MIGVISYGNRKRDSGCFNSKKRIYNGNGAKRAKKARNSRRHANATSVPNGGTSADRERALASIDCGRLLVANKKRARTTTVRAKKKRHRAAKAASNRRCSVSVTAASKKQEQARSTSSARIADGGAASKMCENNPVPTGGTGRKRGHQHHPRFSGGRKSNVPAEDVIAALRGAFDSSGTVTGGGGSISSSSSSSSLLTSSSIVNTDTISTDENANPQLNVIGAEEEDKQMLMTIDANNDDVKSNNDDDVVNNNSTTQCQDIRQKVEPCRDSSESIIEDVARPIEQADELNNRKQNKGSNRNSLVSSDLSSSTTSNVIVIDDDEDDDGGGSVASGEPMEVAKQGETFSSQELVKEASKKLKRSKKSPSSDDSSNTSASRKKSSSSKKSSKSSDGSSSGSGKQRKKVRASTGDGSKLERASGDGAPSDDGIAADENDPDVAEWAKLRCTSERTEVIAEREHRRQKRCADYPGLAFGRSIFSSDTMMKFNIIRNELHNIMKTQLKRAIINNLSIDLHISNVYWWPRKPWQTKFSSLNQIKTLYSICSTERSLANTNQSTKPEAE